MHDDWAITRLPIFDPRPTPHPAPDAEHNADPVRVLCLNAEWAGHVIGVLERLTRSDAWSGDEGAKTRAIDETEKIIAQLSRAWEGGCPSESQDGTGDTPGDEPETPNTDNSDSYPACFAGMVIEVDTMGQVVTDITLEDGVLYAWFGKCCKQPIGNIGEVAQIEAPSIPQPGEEDYPDLPEDYPVATACTKAAYIVSFIAQMVDEMTDSAYAAYTPIDIMTAVRKRWQEIDFGQSSLFQAAGAALSLMTLGAVEETEDPDLLPLLRARIAPYLSDGQQGITSDEYENVKLAIKAETQSFFPYSEWGTVAAPMQVIYGASIDAIGANDIKTLTTALQPGTEDCGLPSDIPAGQEIYGPDANGWVIGASAQTGFTWVDDTTSWKIWYSRSLALHHVYGAIVRLENLGTSNDLKTMNWYNSEGNEGALPGVEKSLTKDVSAQYQTEVPSGEYRYIVIANGPAEQAEIAATMGLAAGEWFGEVAADGMYASTLVTDATASKTVGVRFDGYQTTEAHWGITEFRLVYNNGDDSW